MLMNSLGYPYIKKLQRDNLLHAYNMFMSHTTTEEECGMDFSPSSGEATSG